MPAFSQIFGPCYFSSTAPLTSEALDQVSKHVYPMILLAIMSVGGAAVTVNQWGTSLQIQNGLYSLEKTLDSKMSSQEETFNTKMSTLEKNQSALEKNQSALETKVTSLDAKVTSLDTKMSSLEKMMDCRLMALEKTTSTQFDAMRSENKTAMAEILSRLSEKKS